MNDALTVEGRVAFAEFTTAVALVEQVEHDCLGDAAPLPLGQVGPHAGDDRFEVTAQLLVRDPGGAEAHPLDRQVERAQAQRAQVDVFEVFVAMDLDRLDAMQGPQANQGAQATGRA